ncbi:MAG: hypothetical protein EU550_00045 [Promethearchaeota archaeon]|nr:MAG: hypothetical protein EU550_00045 [Candidatus Lokiarchaeota archaeon]
MVLLIINLGLYDDHFHMMDWFFNVFGIFWWIPMIIGISSYILISIIIGLFMHKDAIKRRIPNPEIWLLIGLIFNLLGLVIYLLARSNYETVESKRVA